MGRYLLRRLAISIPVLFGITLATYAIINLAPGDPVTALINPEAAATLGPEFVQQQRERLGLNQPLPVRYVLWLEEIGHGNLGFSLANGQPVGDRIGERVWPTVRLMLSALGLAIVVAVPVGMLSAVRQYSVLDYVVTFGAFTAISVPSFFLGLLCIYVFALRLGWLPTAGMATVGQPASLDDTIRHLVLPALVLGLAEAAPLIRYARSSLLEVIHQEYVVVARAKGLSERLVLYRHALRNALIPLVTVIALGLPRLFGGTVIIEAVFAWPGMGSLALMAVAQRDYPLIMAINLISACIILLSNLVADVIYAFVDPRIKYA
jgi:peptide/nickel transport system permease protein